MKSSYPNKIDTSKELEIFKDNLTELRSNIFNSYRSAIIQIEKTLGINPNGIEGQSLATRLNQSLDDQGNIKKEALSYLNLLSGPIKNEDVKSDANISEEKLKLNFSTNFLYNQALSLKKLIDELDKFLDDINSKLSSHLNLDAVNRHKAKAISLEQKTTSSNMSSSLTALEDQSLQEFAEKIIFNHINYTGSSISAVNRSHDARQIYFDNSKVQDFILSNNLQSVIENIVNADAEYLRSVVISLASNSRLRNGQISDPQSGKDSLEILTSAGYVSSINNNNTFTISFSASQTASVDILKSDLLRISGFSNAEYDGDYYVKDNVDSGNSFSSIVIYGNIDLELINEDVNLYFYKNNFSDYNSVGLNLSTRSKSSYSGLEYIIASDPNSAKIVSNGIRVFEINSSNSELKIVIDGGTEHTIDVYDSDVYSSIGYITIESVIEKINKYASTNNLPIAATKTITSSQDEISIFHLVPNLEIDSKRRTLKIISSNAISSLGFLDSKDKEHMGFGLNKIIVNGSIISKHFNHKSLIDYKFSAGSNKITRISGSFISDGVSEGNLIFIESNLTTDDNGCYLITDVSDLFIELDYTFANSNSGDTSVLLLKNTASIKDFTFSELSIPTLLNTSGSMYFDVYYDEKSFSLFLSKKMEISGLTRSPTLSIGISKISNNFINDEEEITISIDSNGNVTFLDSDLSTSAETRIVSTGRYIVYNNSKTKFIELDISMNGSLFTSKILKFYGTEKSSFKNLKVGSFLFSNSLGRVFGSAGTNSGIPSFNNEAKAGPIDEKKISDSFVETKIGAPLFESIGNYVAFGLNLTSISATSSNLTLSISGGVAYIKGRRISIKNKIDMTFSNLDSAKNYYLILNEKGSFDLKEEISSSDYLNYSKSFDKNEISIGHYNGSNQEYSELTIPLDSINQKLNKIIYVNPTYIDSSLEMSNKKCAHFSNIHDAVNYLKFHKKITGSSYTPKLGLLDGKHILSKTVSIDFPIEIFGVSDSCTIEPSFSSGSTLSLLTGDISTSKVFSDSNSMFKINVNEYSQTKFIFKNINISYTAASDGIICGILINHPDSLSFSNIEIEKVTFTTTSNSQTNTTVYRFMIPIVLQNLTSSGAIETAQTFSNLYLNEVDFKSIQTNGYGVLFSINGNSNNLYRINANCCSFYSSKVFSSSLQNQVFCASETIIPTSLFNASDFSIINSVSEQNTMIV